MAFFSITSTVLSETGSNVVFVFRPDDPSIASEAALGGALAEHGCITGTRWKFRGAHARLFDPRRVVIGVSGIVQATQFIHACTEGAPEPSDG